MKMCAKWQTCIIKTVGGDVLTRFCLEEEEEKKNRFFCKTRSLWDMHRDLINTQNGLLSVVFLELRIKKITERSVWTRHRHAKYVGYYFMRFDTVA